MRSVAFLVGLLGAAEGLKLSMSVDVLGQAHASCLGRITESLSLEPSDYTTTLGLASIDAGPVKGDATWLKEASPKFLTGVSSSRLIMPGGLDFRLEAWMGPSYEVPHMLLRLRASPDGGLAELSADYVSRNDLASCSDSYRELHYGPDVMNWWTKAAQNGSPCAAKMQWQGRLLNSPAAIHVAMQDANLVSALAQEHVERWLSWLVDAEPLQARRRGAMNSRDDALRRFAYASNVGEMVSMVGNDQGPSIAAAITGPVSEAYVGGGS